MTRSRRDTAILGAVLCTGAFACLPAAAGAQETGGTAPPRPATAVATGGTGYGDAGRPSLVANPVALLGRTLHVRGTLPGAAGRRVVVQRLDARRGWVRAASARVRSTERFLVRWRTDRAGRFALRAVVARGAGAQASSTPSAAVTVYRPARATWYGPGLFGNRTACGATLTPELHGVAHRTLPCGTLVDVLHGGLTITVPVVDRGPFREGVHYDLTQATAQALGFDGVGQVGVVRAP